MISKPGQSPAVEGAPTDPELALVVARWLMLPEAAKAAVMALVTRFRRRLAAPRVAAFPEEIFGHCLTYATDRSTYD